MAISIVNSQLEETLLACQVHGSCQEVARALVGRPVEAVRLGDGPTPCRVAGAVGQEEALLAAQAAGFAGEPGLGSVAATLADQRGEEGAAGLCVLLHQQAKPLVQGALIEARQERRQPV